MANRKQEKRGLGRGLSALMADVDLGRDEGTAKSARQSPDRHIPIDRIRPNPDQPRRDFVSEDLEDLASSISAKGVIQPLILRADPTQSDMYQIVAGERRWRAAQMAKLHEVPAVIRDLDNTEVLEIAIIENIQRADLNAVEEAMGYRQLQDKFGHTQEQLSAALGKSRSHIANLLRLLTLPDDVLGWLREGKLTSGHARALITSDDPVALARMVIQKKLSVRETEKLAKATGDKKPASPAADRAPKDADTKALEGDLAAGLGMKVSIDHKPGKEAGSVTIQYKDFTQLDELCRRLSQLP